MDLGRVVHEPIRCSLKTILLRMSCKFEGMRISEMPEPITLEQASSLFRVLV